MIELDPFEICGFGKICKNAFINLFDPSLNGFCLGLNAARGTRFTCCMHPSLGERADAGNDKKLSSRASC